MTDLGRSLSLLTISVLLVIGWLHTGDLVHYDEAGYIFVTDRMKEMIKYRGHHVSPAMVEQALLSHPGVSEVAVLAIPNEIDDEHPIAFITMTSNLKVSPIVD